MPKLRKSGHTAASKGCEGWKYEKSVLQYKAQNDGTFTQARAAISFFQPSSTGIKSYATVAKEIAQSSKHKPSQGGYKKVDPQSLKQKHDQIKGRKVDAQNLNHRPYWFGDKSEDAQKLKHKLDLVKDGQDKQNSDALNKTETGKDNMQNLPVTETQNSSDFLSQPVISLSERISNDEDAYLSSSLPDMPMETNDPPSLSPNLSPMSWADQSPFPDDEEFSSAFSSPKEGNLMTHKSPKHPPSDREKSKENPPRRSLFKKLPPRVSSQTNSCAKDEESRQKNLSFGSKEWNKDLHKKNNKS